MNPSFRLYYYSCLIFVALVGASSVVVDAFWVGRTTTTRSTSTARAVRAAAAPCPCGVGRRGAPPFPARRHHYNNNKYYHRLAADVASSSEGETVPSVPTPSTTDAAAAATATSGGSSSSAPPQPQRQALYGSTLEYPDSYVRCGKCEAIYAIHPDDLGRGRGRRLECAVCQHSWFQSKDRLMTVKTGEYEMIPMPQRDLTRIQQNIAEGKMPKFVGNKKLYVGNVAFECHEDDLFEIFGKVGEVGDVSLVRDEEGKNRGFGFVTMRTDAGGEKAIAELDGLAVRGRNIAVRESNS